MTLKPIKGTDGNCCAHLRGGGCAICFGVPGQGDHEPNVHVTITANGLSRVLREVNEISEYPHTMICLLPALSSHAPAELRENSYAPKTSGNDRISCDRCSTPAGPAVHYTVA